MSMDSSKCRARLERMSDPRSDSENRIYRNGTAKGTDMTHKGAPLPEEEAKISTDHFGPDARHAEDYWLYYSNIKDNAAKRAAAYLATR